MDTGLNYKAEDVEELLSSLQNAVDEGHAQDCYAIHGPLGETWTIDADCDCWRKKAVEILSKYE